MKHKYTHVLFEFSSIMPAIAKMDADVISIEAARSGISFWSLFTLYPNAVDPVFMISTLHVCLLNQKLSIY